MLKKARFDESKQFIREHLVTLHDDGDCDSLFVRFSEIANEFEEKQMRLDSWNRVSQLIFEHNLQHEGTDY